MSEEHVKGGLKKVGGRIKEAAGALTGDQHLKAEGQFDQVKGGAHQAWGDVKDAARNLADRVRDYRHSRGR
jgi:uncharacterized protein YjbJ (UPF0337 family)